MNIYDRIKTFQNYALTTGVSLYNEDSRTAQGLVMQSARKIRECMIAVNDLAEAIENIKTYIKMNYDGDSEELEITVETKVQEIKTQVNNTYIDIFNENAMDVSELAGRIAQNSNECVKAVNMLCDLVLDLNTFISLHYDPETEMLSLGGEENE